MAPSEETAAALRELNAKLDTLIASLPVNYVGRVEHDHRLAEIERNIEKLQDRYLTDLKQHSEEKEELVALIQEVERRILDRMEAAKRANWSIYVMIFVGLLSFVGTMISTFMHH